MTTYEILTIILTVFSGLIAVSAIIVPLILNYLTKRAENKKSSPKELDKLQYNEYRLKYMNLVNELSLNFSKYITFINGDDKAILVSNIYRLIFISDSFLKLPLNKLLNEVQSEVFNKKKICQLFNDFLEEISEKNFKNYWYGLPLFTPPHSDLIDNRNKNDGDNMK